MKGFIEITLKGNNHKRIDRLSDIKNFYFLENYTRIFYYNDENYAEVKESIEEIKQLIKNAQ